MFTEDYVSFEVAKLLKKKGFVVSYDSFRGVYINGKFLRRNPGQSYLYNMGDEIIDVCSLQMTMKWLREEKHIFIEVLVDTMIKGAFTWRLFEYPSLEIMPYDGWEYTYEEACEEAIKYCLEHLI